MAGIGLTRRERHRAQTLIALPATNFTITSVHAPCLLPSPSITRHFVLPAACVQAASRNRRTPEEICQTMLPKNYGATSNT